MDITAAVISEIGADFTIETVQLAEPAADEVVVAIAGVGLCHTDLAVRHGHLPFPFPAVLGHEGSGTVTAIGHAVTKVAPGDKVVLSFNSCGICPQCKDDAPGYCPSFAPLNFGGGRVDGTSPITRDGAPLGSEFFGQSSFASHAIAHERNVVKVANDAPLELLGPLGCGVQTGAGSVLNSLDCQPGSSLLVVGGGAVGLSAVMAAAARGVETVIVLETYEIRRQLALELGATHVLDPADGPLSEQVRAIVPAGVNYAIDTVAIADVLGEVVLSMTQRGTVVLLGVPSNPEATLPLPLLYCQGLGLRIIGVVEGDSNPDTFIPELLEMHRRGQLPLEKLITTFPFEQLNEAIAQQHRGDVLKVVLTP
ncbi:NAD(P)-dependent alcohol dehydrogenase (plasmid) [Rhodococcus erythropolis]|uniref:NAD(P)-dependent alcohol dehydrogenase n=1 Tax=Rhodococcus TaxID=1827 RepID=UPI00124437DE|nr:MULTISPECIES: NAD(P)-dependent alcohol dehydrogenase [Rhodococcus]MCJ0949895.1 NAD(P)-dependent alcohol dehydrogenase [Rhodococcus sp. ARC_M8]MCQ4152109.1 NAD(P)-dependent alcohol dehydrogenase [Rhodococcus qingshengii]MDJ0441235.1 NAD(P)-dependent alcohol dehydrogenase [Rhodococcus qingshengii]QEX08445.1 NAD(P)-dependent alcohol dehydrogenase [Rhodococcus erythropolis]